MTDPAPKSPLEWVRPHVRELKAYQPGHQPAGDTVIKLNTNENAFPPGEVLAQAHREFPVDSLRKYPPPTSLPLRERLAGLWDIAPENIIAANGSDEILTLIFRAFTDGTRPVSFAAPTYSLYPVLARIQNTPYTEIPVKRETMGIDWTSFKADPAPVSIIPNPNAPTGIGESLESVRSAAGQRPDKLWIIDEAYNEFGGESAIPLTKEFANIMVTRTVSKSGSLAGLRLGFAIGHPTLIGAMFKIKDSYNVNSYSHWMGLAAFSDAGLGETRERVRQIMTTREKTVAELSNLGFHTLPSAANFVFTRPPEAYTPGAAGLFRALEARHIYTRYFPGDLTGNYLRVTIGTELEMKAFLGACAEELRRA